MGLRLGYLVPEFPGQTHVFFWHEVEMLREAGTKVFLISTRKPAPEACRHAFAPGAIAETHYLFPPWLAAVASLASVGGRGLMRGVAYLQKLEERGPASRLRQCGLMTAALDLGRWARCQRIDHIHVHSCADAAHVVAMTNRMGGPAYSLSLHGDLDVYGLDHKSKMQEAAFICTDGAHLRRQVVERAGVSSDRVITTFMGVKTAELNKLGTDRRSVAGTLHLVTVARLNPAKGHLHALAAVDRAVRAGFDIRYTIAGEGTFRERLQARIHELGLEARVTLTGTMSESEVAQLLSEADAFVLPSTGLGEAWPVIVMQAMAAGLPVIASVIGATPEMIRSGEDGLLVPQGDEEALFEAIVALTRNFEMRHRIGEAARQTACRRFDVSASATALREAICARHNLSPARITDRVDQGSLREVGSSDKAL